MYAIGHVIYGAPITEAIEKVAADRDEELDSEDGGYFTELYNGGGGPAGFIGVELACFDECGPFPFFNLEIPVKIEQFKETTNLVQRLPRAYLDVLGPIQRWIVWSSS